MAAVSSGSLVVCAVFIVACVLLFRHFTDNDDKDDNNTGSPNTDQSNNTKVRIHDCFYYDKNGNKTHPAAFKVTHTDAFVNTANYTAKCTDLLRKAGLQTEGNWSYLGLDKNHGVETKYREGIYFDCMLNKDYRGSVRTSDGNIKSAQQACNKSLTNCRNKCNAVPMLAANEERPRYDVNEHPAFRQNKVRVHLCYSNYAQTGPVGREYAAFKVGFSDAYDRLKYAGLCRAALQASGYSKIKRDEKLVAGGQTIQGNVSVGLDYLKGTFHDCIKNGTVMGFVLQGPYKEEASGHIGPVGPVLNMCNKTPPCSLHGGCNSTRPMVKPTEIRPEYNHRKDPEFADWPEWTGE